jgi:hypothetical protein
MFVPSLLRDQRQLQAPEANHSDACCLLGRWCLLRLPPMLMKYINRDINTTSVVGCSRLMMVAMAKNDS